MSTNDKSVENVTNSMSAVMEAKQPVAVAMTTNVNVLKYYLPFYISHASLFDNRRLKRKRRRWAQNIFKNKNKKKTDTEPSLTINLLSDEEEESQNVASEQQTQQKLLLPQHQKQPILPNFYMNPLLLKTVSSNEPPPLVPLSAPKTVTKNNNNDVGLLMYQQKNKIPFVGVPQWMTQLSKVDNTKKKQRKKRKFNASPILLNTESIVLSDDSDGEVNTTPVKNKHNNNNTIIPKSPVLSLLPELTLTAINNNNNNNNNNINHVKSLNNKSPQSLLEEEEVTVSLVPRHAKTNAQQIKQQKAKSTTTTPTKNEVFPMLPDETTVHTVIANRTYELSLTKLREGLAQGEQTSPTLKDNSATQESLQTPPIALKLSSDLSISLISDEEDDSQEFISNNERGRLSAELLRRQQPQLSVQQLNLAASTSKQPPKRRKLG